MNDDKYYSLLINNVSELFAVYERPSGVLETHAPITLQETAFGANLCISITQDVVRKIEIKSDAPVKAQYLWLELQELSQLSMLLEGEFLKLQRIEYLIDKVKTDWSDTLSNEQIRRTLSSYSSADFLKNGSCAFMNSVDILSAKLLNKWVEIKYEMDIVHPMFLYTVSDCGIPIDCKCATLIETCKPLVQILQAKAAGFSPSDPKHLRPCIKDAIENYGQDLFSEELKCDFNTILSVFVESRNRIAHIRSKQGKDILNGSESLLYAVKFSMLYRRILAELIGVDYSLYCDELKKKTALWNQHEGILEYFLLSKGGKV